MSPPTPLPEATDRSLANARRAVLLGLAACGLAVLATGSSNPRPLASETNSLVTVLVILLALGAIAARQIAASRTRARVRARCLLAAYGFAAALGIVGFCFTLATGEAFQGIGYVLAGLIFAAAGWRTEGTARTRGAP